MHLTPSKAFEAVTQKVSASMTPQTKIAVPLILACSIAWWALDTVRQRDLDRIEANQTAVRKEVSDVLQVAQIAQSRSEDLLLRVTRGETTQQFTGAAIAEMRGDIKGILSELQQMRREAKQ